ncbi:hypothetical protein PVK06_048638 [Gossypium arboreum]|uniref:Uncharacterized protein n=1 Tax=Gossypium arboreum TaxID=29729 RepID=A0ABR0MGZ3_GOSAR|nr:hypothetical protein PVK06_048638 [Gossypium arboreum]
MLLCQQRGIVPRVGKKILENKGPINEASVERITQGKDTSILKEAETSKIRKGKAKADSKRTNLNAETSLWHKMKDVKKMEVSEKEKEKEDEDFVEKVITTPEFVGANIDNLERTGVRPVKVAEVTSKEQCNSWVIVAYTGPL